MLDRSAIGTTGPKVTVPVEALHIARFSRAIGDDNPLFHDETAAKKSKHKGVVAPPTFATIFGFECPSPRTNLEFDRAKLVHGEQEFEYHRPLKAGDRITVQQKIVDIFQKEGRAGSMDFIVSEMTGMDQRGKKVFTARSTAIIRP